MKKVYTVTRSDQEDDSRSRLYTSRSGVIQSVNYDLKLRSWYFEKHKPLIRTYTLELESTLLFERFKMVKGISYLAHFDNGLDIIVIADNEEHAKNKCTLLYPDVVFILTPMRTI